MLERHTIHQSLNRHQLMMGGDRVLVIAASATCGLMALSTGWLGMPVFFFLWVGLVAGLKRMGAADPLMRPVYLRHLTYQPYYPAKAALYSRGTQLPLKWESR